MKISTNVIKPLKCSHFTTNVKIIIDSHDFKYENGLWRAVTAQEIELVMSRFDPT